MLTLFGQSVAERAKSAAIAVLSILLGVSLFQVSSDRMQTDQDMRDKEAARDVARHFAVALTTYDYAHENAQAMLLKAVSSAEVSERVCAAWLDVQAAKAASIGEVTADTVVIASRAEIGILLWMSQVVSSSFAASGATLVGLLDVTVHQVEGRWIVSDFRWLLIPGLGP
jgi:hypothetical protein